MVAELAREDWEDLQAEGLKPTLADFDRLNQLALRLEDGAETSPANYPRIAWVDDVPFYEPTVAAIMWLQDYAMRIASDAETQQVFFYFACAHAREPQVFQSLTIPTKIEKAVRKWLAGVGATEKEIARACNYAAYGFDDAVAAITPMKREYLRRKNKTVAAENMRKIESVLTRAAGATGLSYFDLLAQTPSRLNAMVLASEVEAGLTISFDMAKAQVEYTATLNEIRERLIKERDNGNRN